MKKRTGYMWCVRVCVSPVVSNSICALQFVSPLSLHLRLNIEDRVGRSTYEKLRETSQSSTLRTKRRREVIHSFIHSSPENKKPQKTRVHFHI